MKRVILESPYMGKDAQETTRNIAYARRALRDSLDRNESPIASHLLLTQVLDDSNVRERALGITAGLCWCQAAETCVVYTDLGISPGMRLGIITAEGACVPVEYRQIGE